jgi:hypothetical protein
MKYIIDPPYGWKYDFPKQIPEESIKDVISWLVSNGYPKSIIDEMGETFTYRILRDNTSVTNDELNLSHQWDEILQLYHKSGSVADLNDFIEYLKLNYVPPCRLYYF